MVVKQKKITQNNAKTKKKWLEIIIDIDDKGVQTLSNSCF